MIQDPSLRVTDEDRRGSMTEYFLTPLDFVKKFAKNNDLNDWPTRK